MSAPDRIILGSAKLFMMEFTGSAIPEDATIEVEGNRAGHIKNGASLEYTPTFYNAKDDLGEVQKSRLTEEDVLIKCGVMTITGESLAKQIASARVTEASGKRTVKIGGVGNDNGKKYLIRLLHEDPADGDIRLTIVGRNEAGITLAFAKDSETIVNLELRAHPHDADGTLVIYDEEIPAAT